MNIEICSYNIQSCLTAQKGGASRVELCVNPLEGGVTPSYGMIKYAIETLQIPVFPIIRPRGGNFFYNKEEFEIIKKDILFCKEIGCKGISTGVSLHDGSIDKETMKKIKELSYPMHITCHKVFDYSPDLFKSLEDLIEVGCDRILTSGGKQTALEGIDIIKQIVAITAGIAIIMPGGSLRSSNIKQIASFTGCTEFHSSAITINDDNSFFADINEVKLLSN